MVNNSKINQIPEFMRLYEEVKNNLPDYSKKFQEPYCDEVLSNYYYFFGLLKIYGKENFLLNKNFRYLFVKSVFEGTFDSIENNFQYLTNLKKNTSINIIDDVELLFNLFSYRGFFFINGTIESIEFAHSLVVDANPSEKVYENFGKIEDFYTIIDNIARNKSIPPLFGNIFPGLSFYKHIIGKKTFVECVIINYATQLASDISICEMCDLPLSRGSMSYYYNKLNEDNNFFKERYVSGNQSGIVWSSLKARLKKTKCFPWLIGSFKDIFNKLESISKNIPSAHSNLFDYFMTEENLPLFDKIVTSLNSYIDYSNYTVKKISDFNELSYEIVNELCSKLHLYYYLNENNNNSLFRKNTNIMQTLKYLAQIKKDEIDGVITHQEAISKVNKLFSFYSVEMSNKSGEYSLRCNIRDINSNFTLTTVDSSNFAPYLLLCDDYFTESECFFLDIYDFIMNCLNRSNNTNGVNNTIGLPTDFINLLKINPYMIDYFNIPNDDLKNIKDVIIDALDKLDIVENISFLSKLNPCLAFNFENFDLDSLTMSQEELNSLFDTMAVRYHTRIGFDSFYKNNVSSVINIDGIYSMKNLYKSGTFTWERDRIHTLIYFAYLENNMAHDVSDSAIFSHLRSIDYFSNIFSNDFSANFNSLKKKIETFIEGIKKNCFRPANSLNDIGLSSILKEVKRILSDISIIDKRNALNMYLGRISYGTFDNSFIDLFLNTFNNNSDFCLTYFDLAIEKMQDFENKSKCVKSIILQFYKDLKTMRLENYNESDSLVVTKEEAKQFYEKYGYLIDIRFDNSSKNNCAVLYMMDKHLEFTHSVHISDVPNMVIPSMGNSILEFYDVIGDARVDKNVDSNFEFHIKSTVNCRQNMNVHEHIIPNSDLLNTIKSEFDNDKLFYTKEEMDAIISKYRHLFSGLKTKEAYQCFCKRLKEWNEQELLSKEPSVHRRFGV